MSGPAAEVTDDPASVEEVEEGEQVRTRADELLAHAVPRGRRVREEALHLRATDAQDTRPSARVLGRGTAGPHLLADDVPQPLGERVQARGDHGIEATRAGVAAGHPSLVAEDLQVSADRRLRELQNETQLAHGQLRPLEEKKD